MGIVFGSLVRLGSGWHKKEDRTLDCKWKLPTKKTAALRCVHDKSFCANQWCLSEGLSSKERSSGAIVQYVGQADFHFTVSLDLLAIVSFVAAQSLKDTKRHMRSKNVDLYTSVTSA